MDITETYTNTEGTEWHTLTDSYSKDKGEMVCEYSTGTNRGEECVTGGVYREDSGWHFRISANDTPTLQRWKDLILEGQLPAPPRPPAQRETRVA